jgi:uncharacterized membrane protein
MVVLGWVLIVIGILTLCAGVVGGILTMFEQFKKSPAAAAGVSVLPTAFIEVLTRFLDALKTAPVWLALIVIGIVLVAWGGSMV